MTADASGRIQVQFQLPDGFVATYEVTAMGDAVRRGDDVLHRGQRIVPQYIPRSCELDREL